MAHNEPAAVVVSEILDVQPLAQAVVSVENDNPNADDLLAVVPIDTNSFLCDENVYYVNDGHLRVM